MSTVSNTPRRSVMIASPIPTGMGDDDEDVDPTDAVSNANLVTSTTTSIKDWRPMSSVSQVSQQERLLYNDKEQDLIDEASTEFRNNVVDVDNKEKEEHPPRTLSNSRYHQQSRIQSEKNSHLDNYVLQRKTLREPCKYKPCGGPAKGQHKSFITMTQRSRTTLDGIRGIERNLFNAYGDRVCRPYSTYSVSKSCERLAISPYGGPMLPSAVGRYREHYQSRNPTKLTKAARDALNSKFQKFYINQDLVAITETKKPAGILKKPPSPKVTKPKEGLHNSLHQGATERLLAVQSTLGWKPSPIVSDGKRFGVGYQVAMELSYNLDKHRRARSANVVPDVPPSYQPPQSDKARLNNQSVEYLTNGEIAIRQSVKANLYDPEKPKKEATKFFKKRPPSPPLSKISREKFLPEALRKREEIEKARLFSGHAGLRLGKTTRNAHSRDDVVQSAQIDMIGRSLSRASIQSEEGEGSECSELNLGDPDKDLMIRGQSAKHTPRSAVDLINSSNSYRVTTTPTCSPEPLISRGKSATDKDTFPDEDDDEDDDDETRHTRGSTSRMSGLTEDSDAQDAMTEDSKENNLEETQTTSNVEESSIKSNVEEETSIQQTSGKSSNDVGDDDAIVCKKETELCEDIKSELDPVSVDAEKSASTI